MANALVPKGWLWKNPLSVLRLPTRLKTLHGMGLLPSRIYLLDVYWWLLYNGLYDSILFQLLAYCPPVSYGPLLYVHVTSTLVSLQLSTVMIMKTVSEIDCKTHCDFHCTIFFLLRYISKNSPTCGFNPLEGITLSMLSRVSIFLPPCSSV